MLMYVPIVYWFIPEINVFVFVKHIYELGNFFLHIFMIPHVLFHVKCFTYII